MAEKKVVDIASADDAKVEIGSKPMIVGHKSLAGDPMMRTESENLQDMENDTLNEKLAQKAATISVPDSEDKISSETAVQEEKPIEQQVSNPAVEENKEIVEKEVAQKDTKKPEPVLLNKDDAAKKENDDAIDVMDKEKELQKILDSKQYHVSIKQARGSSRFLPFAGLVGLLVILLSAYLLVDSGKVDVGVDVPVHIIGKEEVATQITPVAESKKDDTATSPEEVELSKNWLVFDTPDYSMRIPDGWEIAKKQDNESSIYSLTAVYAEGNKAVVGNGTETSEQKQKAFNLDVTNDSAPEYCSSNFNEGAVSTFKTENNNSVYKKVLQATSDTVAINYCIQVEDTVVASSYVRYPKEADQEKYVEEAMSTIKLR